MRYSSQGRAVRKSVYCEAFIDFFVEVAAFMKYHDVPLHLDEPSDLESAG